MTGAAIAQPTVKLHIGTAVTLLPYHNPLRLAEEYATLDSLSDGRSEIAIGHGFIKWESLTFGTPLEELRDRFQENLAIILKAWRQPRFCYKGKFYRYENIELLVASLNGGDLATVHRPTNHEGVVNARSRSPVVENRYRRAICAALCSNGLICSAIRSAMSR